MDPKQIAKQMTQFNKTAFDTTFSAMTVLQELTEKNKITIEVTDEALDWLAAIGYDVNYGARPLKRTIQKFIVNPLSQKLIEGEFVSGDNIEITLDNRGMVSFHKK